MTLDLPAINASLNGAAMVLLTLGFIFIKAGNRDAHRRCMVGAFLLSVVFLICYVANRIAMRGLHTEFKGEGIWAAIYYPMLFSHILLAMAIVPLVLRTLYLAVNGRYEAHRKWARWTFPIW